MEKKVRKTRILWGVAVLLALSIMVGACSPAPATALPKSEEPTKATITVNGTGEVLGSPDLATIQLGVNVRDTDLAAAVDNSNRTMERIRSALGELGVAAGDLQTTNFSVWPENIFDPETGQMTEQIRYHVDSTVQVTVRQVDRLSEVLKAGLGAGANNVFGISFSVADPSELAGQARTRAVADAMSRASELAQALGVTLGAPTMISEYGSEGVQVAVAREVGIGGGGPPISPGQLSVVVQVQVTFELIP